MPQAPEFHPIHPILPGGGAEGGSGAAVRFPGQNVAPGFWGRVDRGNVGGVRNPAGRSATEFPTLDFRGT